MILMNWPESNTIPPNWHIVEGATTAPLGYVIIANNVSRFEKGRETAIIKEENIMVSDGSVKEK